MKGTRAFKPTIFLDDNPEECLLRPFLEMQMRKPKAAMHPDREMFLAAKILTNPTNLVR